MKARRLTAGETLGYCHDCHNRARIVVTFAHRDPIRLCDRCAGFLIRDVSEVRRNGPKNGKKNNKH